MMNDKRVFVTAYKSPDLDGSACAYAYAELLRAIGQDVMAVIFGTLRREAQFAFDKVETKISGGEELLKPDDEVVLVDSCEIKGISSSIDPLQVIEVIDHRSINNAENEFKNAKIQIDLVGSCATLIVEKFIAQEIAPSEKSATLLYLAIASNTINFKNKITTERDVKAAGYLKNLYQIDGDLIREMFVHQSKMSGSIKEILHRDKWHNEILGKDFSVFQFEIVAVDDFIEKNLDEIKSALKEIEAQEGFDFVLVTCVDLEKARNTFIVEGGKNEKLLGDILGVKFEDGIAHYPEIIMRKEIMPKIKDYYSNNHN